MKDKKYYDFLTYEEFKKKHGKSYEEIHRLMRKIKPEPDFCTICYQKHKYDGRKFHLCNIGHQYDLNPKNWIYLCCSCHNLMDFCFDFLKDYNDFKRLKIVF